MKQFIKTTTSALAIVAATVLAGSPAAAGGLKIGGDIGRVWEQGKKDAGNGAEVLYETQKDVVNAGIEASKQAGQSIWGKASDGVEGVVTIATTPEQLAWDVLVKQQSLGDSADSRVGAVEDSAIAILKVPTVITDIEQAAVATVAPAIGPDATTAVAFVLLPEQVLRGLPAAIAAKAIKVSEGEPVGNLEGMVMGLPLQAAIEMAIDYYKPKAQPLPTAVKALLVGTQLFDPATIENARYVVDNSGDSVPAVINRLMHHFGADNHAVTVGNIIVFQKEPGLVEDIRFWAHETWHTQQYQNEGVPGFARRYAEDYRGIESEAEAKGEAASQVYFPTVASN